MAIGAVSGGGNEARSGAQALMLLAAPLNVLLLEALDKGPMQQAELRRATGTPAQTTLRAQLKRLVASGAVEAHRRNSFPGTLQYELSLAGEDLCRLVAVLERWLADAPDGPLAIGGTAAKAAVTALSDSWSTKMLRTLAAGPVSLTELDGLIAALSYPSLERRLGAMRLAGLAEPRPGGHGGKPHAVTHWLRRGVAPLLVAARWERRHLAETTPPLGSLDIEAASLLTAPLLRLPSEQEGTCRVAVELTGARGHRQLAGILVDLQDGRVASCSVRLREKPDAWALGSTSAWLDMAIDSDFDRMERGGDCALAHAVLAGLHDALFAGSPQVRP